MITNQVSVTIPQAYFSLPRHIRKGMLIKWLITSDSCTAVLSWLPAISQRIKKLQKRIMFERNYSFYHHCCCPPVTWCSKNINLSKLKWGAQAVVRRWGHGSPMASPCSDGTGWQQLEINPPHFKAFDHIYHFAWVKFQAIPSKILNVIGPSSSRSSNCSFP